jgi:hypothetical protein
VQNDQPGALDIWVYDPGFVNTGPQCAAGQADDWNDIVHSATVYATFPDPKFCTGDSHLTGGTQSGPALDTTFEVLAPDGSVACSPQVFPGYDAGPLTGPNTAHAAGPGNRTYEGFHQWYKLCSIAGVPTTPGHEYRVHVTSGGGLFTNQFSLLALHGPVPGNQLTIFTRERLPLVAVDTAVDHANPPEFYLARVLPSSKDRVLEVDFFDLGDTSLDPDLSGQLDLVAEGVTGFGGFDKCTAVLPPSNGSPSQPPPPFDSSLFTPPGGGTCSWHYDAGSASNTWDGRWVAITIPIPAATKLGGWDCDTTQFDQCWIKLRMNPTADKVSDATTWRAGFRGSPVRLVG